MAEFDGKTVLITGAARGIGRAIALKFAEQGANLALCDLKAEWIEDTRKAAADMGRKVVCYTADAAKASDVAAVVEAAAADFGGIDVLVNNAGITRDGFLVRMSEQDWDDVMNVNLKGTFLFTKAVAKIMMKRRSGAIVNIASVIGLIGNAGQCNYAASKAGVIAFTKSAARELASRNIRVNAVAPGYIETKMTEVLPAEIKGKMLEAIPAQRFGAPDDVAEAALFIAGGRASYVTGQVLNVSGGMVM